MKEKRLIQIQNILDSAIEKASELFALDISLRSANQDSVNRELSAVVLGYAEEKRTLEDVKQVFKMWLETIKDRQSIAMIKAKEDDEYSLGRRCYSIGCNGFVQYQRGRGVCLVCGLSQVILEKEFYLSCTSTSISKGQKKSAHYSEERNKLIRKEVFKSRSENVTSLF